MPDAPPGLGWVSSFAESLARADEDLSVGALRPTRDPLQWVVPFRLAHGRPWSPALKDHIRVILRGWLTANECVYVRSGHDGPAFVVTVIVKYPSRRQITDPLEAFDAHDRRR